MKNEFEFERLKSLQECLLSIDIDTYMKTNSELFYRINSLHKTQKTPYRKLINMVLYTFYMFIVQSMPIRKFQLYHIKLLFTNRQGPYMSSIKSITMLIEVQKPTLYGNVQYFILNVDRSIILYRFSFVVHSMHK